MRCWLLKTEPESYTFETLLRDGLAAWDGVRNAQAANNLRVMAVGDEAFIYHSGGVKAVVGLARVTRAAYPDPTDAGGRFVAVDIEPVQALQAVPLAAIKAQAALAGLAMLRQSRLSVSPVTTEERAALLQLAG